MTDCTHTHFPPPHPTPPQKLNKYVDELQTIGPPKPVKLDFTLVEEGQAPKDCHVEMSKGGDLSPLFLAFGLIEVRCMTG